MRNKKIELLAPAGDFECLTAAINAGADAVYFGLKEFSMRARAKNFEITELAKIKEMCKLRKVKKYLTLNTIVYDEEITKIEKLILMAKPYIDAVICWDPAIMLICNKHKVPFFVSTQASVSNSSGANFYKKIGAKRIIPARELNIKQIKSMSKIIPTEVFAHGAMCVSISGRCLMSQHLHNESANRGRCLQPCRRHYDVKDDQGNELRVDNPYIFSAKDLCTLPFLEEIKKAGVSAIKIEGRNREPEYVDVVVRAYRRALDKKLTEKELKESLDELNRVYTKGFSSGFYLGVPTSDDFSDTENSKAQNSKQFLGKITHYYDKIGVGLLKLNTGTLNIGDEVIIIGKTTGVVKVKIESMQIEHKPVLEIKKKDEAGIKLPFCRKGDEVYKIVKNIGKLRRV